MANHFSFIAYEETPTEYIEQENMTLDHGDLRLLIDGMHALSRVTTGERHLAALGMAAQLEELFEAIELGGVDD